jgi:hypothetical protein
MTDILLDEIIDRPRQPKLIIEMPDGDPLVYRPHFAKTKLDVDDRTARRYNFETVYVGGHPYIRQNKSLKALADRAQSRRQTPKRRRP